MSEASENGRMRLQLALRTRGISDHAVLRAMDDVPRERFVPPEWAEEAYADQALPIACGQTISQPYVVAFMTESLMLRPHHRVLEVGTGSGYQAAVLSRLVREVVSIERFVSLADAARDRLQACGFDNVTVLSGDGTTGAPERAPFDRIIVTAAADAAPQLLVQQLVMGGVLVLPLGAANEVQQLTRLTRMSGALQQDALLPVRFVPLISGAAHHL